MTGLRARKAAESTEIRRLDGAYCLLTLSDDDEVSIIVRHPHPPEAGHETDVPRSYRRDAYDERWPPIATVEKYPEARAELLAMRGLSSRYVAVPAVIAAVLMGWPFERFEPIPTELAEPSRARLISRGPRRDALRRQRRIRRL